MIAVILVKKYVIVIIVVDSSVNILAKNVQFFKDNFIYII